MTSAEHAKRPSATKSGPGRYHSSGTTKASPFKSKGAPRGFVLHKNPRKAALRRAVAAAGGIRQFNRKAKEERRRDKEFAARIEQEINAREVRAALEGGVAA